MPSEKKSVDYFKFENGLQHGSRIIMARSLAPDDDNRVGTIVYMPRGVVGPLGVMLDRTTGSNLGGLLSTRNGWWITTNKRGDGVQVIGIAENLVEKLRDSQYEYDKLRDKLRITPSWSWQTMSVVDITLSNLDDELPEINWYGTEPSTSG